MTPGAPYDTYAAPDHQLCCAHALRELQAVTDAAPAGQWCWASQATEAITAMQDLVCEAISQGCGGADQAALAAHVRLFRSAVLAGASHSPDGADHGRRASAHSNNECGTEPCHEQGFRPPPRSRRAA
jgi:transposase